MQADTIGQHPEQGDRRVAGAVGTVLVFAVAIVAFFLLTEPVPDVVGQPAEVARETIDQAGFDAYEKDPVPALSENEVGTVVAQDPAGGIVWVWTDIGITVASEMEGPDATADGTDGSTPSVRGDSVMATTPVVPGSSRYYKEPVPVTPPTRGLVSVLGMTESAAVSTLRSAGYGVVLEYGPSTTSVPAGSVFYQDPAPETPVDEVSTVEIWISTGPPTDGMPYPQPD